MERKEEGKAQPPKEPLGRLLLCDVDGTLLVDGTVSEQDASALRRWQAAGHSFGLVTGRGDAFCRELCAGIGVRPDVLVTDNGATVWVRETCVHRDWLACGDVAAALDRLPGWPGRFLPFVTMPDGWHRFPLARAGDAVMEKMRRVQAHLTYFSEQDLEDLLQKTDCVPGLSLYVWKDEDAPAVLTEAGREVPGFQWHQTSHDYVEAAAADKARALETLLEHVQAEEIFYVGDGPNDLPVLDVIADSYVMSTAPAFVKERGRCVTDSVAAVIERKLELDYVA